MHQKCDNRMIAAIVLAASTCLIVALISSMSTAYLQHKSGRLGQACMSALMSAHVPKYAHVAYLSYAHLWLERQRGEECDVGGVGPVGARCG